MEATTRQQMEDTFYILATDAPADYVSRVLKDGETFAVFDPHGDIQAAGVGQEGLYHEGTRFLSRLLFKLGNARPLSSQFRGHGRQFALRREFDQPGRLPERTLMLPRGTLHITRTKLLRESRCHETLRFINYGLSSVEVYFSMEFDADFADLSKCVA